MKRLLVPPFEFRPEESATDRDTAGDSGVRTARVEASDGAYLYLDARPAPAGEFDGQIREAYRSLARALAELGGGPDQVVTEKVFLGDLEAQWRSLETARQAFYGDGGRRPAATTLVQPPVVPGRRCEIQVQAFLPRNHSRSSDEPIGSLRGFASARVLRRGGARLVHLANLTGGVPGDGLDFGGQAAAMFRLAAALLERERLTFRDVVRTWLYLPDLERDYAALNRARRDFFDSVELDSFPASTGIQGRVPPAGRDCGLDLFARQGGGADSVRSIHSPTMNEAPEYGALFSRGARVDFADYTEIHLSGTASIDASGRVVHSGDPAGQASVMLDNVERLLAGQGADLSHVVSAVTYLKRPGDLPVVASAFHRRDFSPRIPHTLCRAEVCRPDWLMEMEAVAVLPRP